MDALQTDLAGLIAARTDAGVIWAAGRRPLPAATAEPPRLSESWFCCAEPTDLQHARSGLRPSPTAGPCTARIADVNPRSGRATYRILGRNAAPVPERPPKFVRGRGGVVVGVKFEAANLLNRSKGSADNSRNMLLHKGFGGARGIRTLDPSYPGYRISRSPERCARQGTPGHLIFRTASVRAPRGMRGNPRWDSVGTRDGMCLARPKQRYQARRKRAVKEQAASAEVGLGDHDGLQITRIEAGPPGEVTYVKASSRPEMLFNEHDERETLENVRAFRAARDAIVEDASSVIIGGRS